jgi:hypothetical protein
MQDDTASEESETLAFSDDPYMLDVLSGLPADWSHERKMRAIANNYGKKIDMMHFWDDEGDIPKLTQFAEFLGKTYKNVADFERLRPRYLFAAARVAQEKIYKFCLPLTVRPPTSPGRVHACPDVPPVPLRATQHPHALRSSPLGLACAAGRRRRAA